MLTTYTKTIFFPGLGMVGLGLLLWLGLAVESVGYPLPIFNFFDSLH